MTGIVGSPQISFSYVIVYLEKISGPFAPFHFQKNITAGMELLDFSNED